MTHASQVRNGTARSVFTRQHYQVVAAIMADLFYDCDGRVNPMNDDATLERVRDAFANVFAGDNPRFNSERFLDACCDPDTPPLN